MFTMNYSEVRQNLAAGLLSLEEIAQRLRG